MITTTTTSADVTTPIIDAPVIDAPTVIDAPDAPTNPAVIDAPTVPTMTTRERYDASVKFARYGLHGKNPALASGQRPAAASCGDHDAVRKVITGMIDGEVTVPAIVAVSGMKSKAAITRAAKFESPTSALAPMRAVGGKFTGQKNAAWRQGRYLAGIIAAWIREIEAAA